jgi:hypothetical protein
MEKLAVLPESLERKIIPCLRREDMDHHIVGIDDGPSGFIPDAAKPDFLPSLLESLPCGFGQGFEVRTACARGEHEVIGDGGYIPYIKDPEVFAFTGVESVVTTLEMDREGGSGLRCRNGHKVCGMTSFLPER